MLKNLNPIRKPTNAGDTTKFEFELDVSKFLVKNMSGGDITVTLDPPEGAENSWLIPDEAWQMIPGSDTQEYHKALYVTATSTSATSRGVEVEAIDYRLPKRRL